MLEWMKWSQGSAEIIAILKFFIAIIYYCNLLIYKDTNENMMLHPKTPTDAIQCKLLDC